MPQAYSDFQNYIPLQSVGVYRKALWAGSFLSNDRTCGNIDHPDQTLLDSAKASLDLRRNDGPSI